MKDVLIFANESQFSKEIIHFFLSKHFNVHVCSIKPFKDKTIFISALPLQLKISIMNVANHYNWKHEVSKHDIIINTLQYNDFQSYAQSSVFENFTHQFAEATLNLGKKVIYLSNVLNESSYTSHINEAEQSMIQINQDIFYTKYAFLIDSKSRFLLSIMNSPVIFTSKNVLKSTIAITNSADIQNHILNIINGTHSIHNTYLSGESFTISDIIEIIQRYIGKKAIITLPHFLLQTLGKILGFFPQSFYARYLNYKYIIKRLEHNNDYPKHNRNTHYTLFALIIEKHSRNIWNPKID